MVYSVEGVSCGVAFSGRLSLMDSSAGRFGVSKEGRDTSSVSLKEGIEESEESAIDECTTGSMLDRLVMDYSALCGLAMDDFAVVKLAVDRLVMNDSAGGGLVMDDSALDKSVMDGST